MNINQFTNDLDISLYVLLKQKEIDGKYLTASDITSILINQYGIKIHPNRIHSLFEKNLTYIDRKKKSKVWNYQILDEGIQKLSSSSKSLLIDPLNSVQATIHLHDILKSLSGDIKICDPYFDYKSLEHLHAISYKNSISILTYNIKDSGTLKRLLQSYQTEKYNITIKVASNPILHDRYIIDDKKLFLLGTSLNGIGKKQSFIIDMSENIRLSTLQYFNNTWNISNAWS
jgi:hypothetical protein